MYQFRSEIFVLEQSCIYLDIDDIDKTALHVIGFDDSDSIACYARVYSKDMNKTFSFGRVAVAMKYRQRNCNLNISSILLEKVLSIIGHDKTIHISAQDYIKNFYVKFGFQSIGEVYVDDGIPHVDMVRNA